MVCARFSLVLLLSVLTATTVAGDDVHDGTPHSSRVTQESEPIAGREWDEWRTVLKSLDPASEAAADEVPALIAVVTASHAPDPLRRQAAALLGRIGEPAAAAVPIMAELLSHRGEQQYWAIKSLTLFGSTAVAAAPQLADIARSVDTPLLHRTAALEALARIGPEASVTIPVLTAFAEGTAVRRFDPSEREQLQAVAADVLQYVGPAGASAVPSLMRAAQDESERVRRTAVTTLGALGGVSAAAIPVLVDLLLFDESPSVRDRAATALGNIGSPAIPTLQMLLTDADADVRWRAALAAGALPTDSLGTAAIEPIVQELTRAVADESPAVRLAAIESLVALKAEPQTYLRALVQALTEPHRDYQIRAYRQLQTLPASAFRQAVPHLRQIAEEAVGPTRAAARKLLQERQATSGDNPVQ